MNITGQRIKQLRTEAKMTQKELAEKLQLKSYTSIVGWEKGEYYPRGLEVINMCKFFNVSADYLYGLIDKRNWEQ